MNLKETIKQKPIIIIGGVILFIILSYTGYILNSPTSSDVKVLKANDITEGISVSTNTYSQSLEKKPVEEIKIYMLGCVNKPGIITLKKGQIINDAIALAGGATQDADLEHINLVYQLKENMMIKIKSKTESIKNQNNNKNSEINQNAGNGLELTREQHNSGIEVIQDSGGVVNNDTPAIVSKDKNQKTSLININTATADQLDTLPGIGKATAQKIIDYREKNGVFKMKEDLMNVSGIGKSKFSSIKDLIMVD